MGLTATRARFGLIACIAMSCMIGTTVAGPAKYDETQRGFRFTYTYASLAVGVFGEQAIGAPQRATTEQDAQVRAIVLAVSDALSKATGGRAKILSLDHVDDAKKADVVISLTGNPGRGGWAIAGAINGAPGQIGLYWQVLEAEWKQDVVLTAAHEVCHYIFGLTDEYNFPQGCPVANQGGPGCLMDNYLSNGSRHGWYGRFCKEDHNPQSQQPKSCQAIVDEFFKGFKLSEPPREQTPQNKIDNIANATIARVRQEAETRNKANGPGKKLTAISSLSSIAKNFLTTQLQANGLDPKSVDTSKLVGTILQTAASVVSVDPPVRLASEVLIDMIKRVAKDHASKLKQQNPKISDSTLKTEIVKQLKSFVATQKNAPLVTGALNPEETSYLEHVAMQAASAVAETDINQQILKATLDHIKLSRNIARDTVDAAAEVGVPGIPERLAALGEIDADLRLYLPGRTAATGFGMRRTIILDPEPFDPSLDFILTDAGIFRYNELRALYINQFRKLVDRAKIELVVTKAQQENESNVLNEKKAWLDGEKRNAQFLELARKMLNKEAVRAEREAEFRRMITEVSKELRSNKYENIIILVPPGGFQESLVVTLEAFRRQLMAKGDVRLDVVTVGAAAFPAELRDACVGSGGSIATIADVDEVGALAQRLKNEQSTGAWVVLPQQGTLTGTVYSDDKRKETLSRWLFLDPKMERPGQSPIDKAASKIESVLGDIEEYLKLGVARTDFSGPEQVLQSLSDQVISRLTQLTTSSPSDVDRPTNLSYLVHRVQERVETLNQSRQNGAALSLELYGLLIRARAAESDARTCIRVLLDAYEPRLNPEFDEDAVFRLAYRSAAKKDKDWERLDSDEKRYARLDEVLRVLGEEASRDAFKHSPATLSYINVKKLEVRLRMLSGFLDHLERELAEGFYKPLYTRIDRKLQVEASQKFQDRAPGFIGGVPGYPGRPPMPPVGLEKPGPDGGPVPDPQKARLQRFYAENLKYDPKLAPGEFEFIMGFSKPLPGLTQEAIRSLNSDVLPKLMLHDDNGMPIEAASLHLDQDVSTSTCLVWRFSPEFGIGWYTAVMKFSDETMRRLAGTTVNYTFSIASNRPNVRLSPALIQMPNDPELVPPPPTRGLIRITDRRARVEVQVYGGTSVLNAAVRGVLHKINEGTSEILPLAQNFYDDGKTHGDKTENDGIYTTVIPLEQLQSGGEYRLMIQAESTALSKNIAVENPSVNDDKRRQLAKDLGDKTILLKAADEPVTIKPEEALQFQRATSIHIRVER